jgi:hypothetical protein
MSIKGLHYEPWRTCKHEWYKPLSGAEQYCLLCHNSKSLLDAYADTKRQLEALQAASNAAAESITGRQG